MLFRYRSGKKENSTGTLEGYFDDVDEKELPDDYAKGINEAWLKDGQSPTVPSVANPVAAEMANHRFFRLDTLEGVNDKNIFPPVVEEAPLETGSDFKLEKSKK